MRKLLLLLMIFLSHNLSAQILGPPAYDRPKPIQDEEKEIIYKEHDYSFLGLGFTMIIPRSDFERTIGKNGYGFGLIYGNRFDNTPLFFGGDLSFNWYDFYSYESPFSEFEDHATFGLTNLNLFMRFQSEDKYIIPYFEIVGGVTLISATFTYDTESFSFNDDDESDTELSASWNYGLGGGVMIPLSFISEKAGDHLLFDISGRLMFGTRTSFVNNRDLKYNKGFNYYWEESDTPHFFFRFGFTLR